LALEKAELTHEIVTFPGAGHAFFNDTGQRYNPSAANSAYQQLTEWFGTHLG
jgi:carboxymethylenebutenolidase